MINHETGPRSPSDLPGAQRGKASSAFVKLLSRQLGTLSESSRDSRTAANRLRVFLSSYGRAGLDLCLVQETSEVLNSFCELQNFRLAKLVNLLM